MTKRGQFNDKKEKGIIPQDGIPTFLSIYRFMYGTTKKKSSAVLISVLFFLVS